jgi:hypothetical protein
VIGQANDHRRWHDECRPEQLKPCTASPATTQRGTTLRDVQLVDCPLDDLVSGLFMNAAATKFWLRLVVFQRSKRHRLLNQ